MKIKPETALLIAGFVLIPFFLWGMYTLAKNLSYSLWYEDMVRETVREMVRSEALQEQKK